jgi:hypothetical protein
MNWTNKYNKSGDEEKKYPFSRWISWFFLIGFILLITYTYYRAEIDFQGEESARYFKYYIVSLIGILFWSVVLRLKNEARVNIVVVAISLTVGLYLIEGGLILFEFGQTQKDFKTKRIAISTKLGIEFDKRTRLQVINDLISKGVDAVPTTNPSYLLESGGLYKSGAKLLLPLGGVSKKIAVGSNEGGEYSVYQSDRYGFNNPDTEWDSLQVEWLLLGDSFTHGTAVQQGEDIGSRIRAITNASVINLGIDSNGPLTELASLKEYGEFLRPKKVLWIYYEGNDLAGDLDDEKNNPLLMQYLQDGFSQDLIDQQEEIDSRLLDYIKKTKKEDEIKAKENAEKEAILVKTKWIRLGAIREIIDVDLPSYNDDNVNIDPLFSYILAKAKKRIEIQGGKLYFVYLPGFARYNNVVDNDNFRKRTNIIDLVKKLNIPVIDIHQEVFSINNEPLNLFPLRISGHYNAEGFDKVARSIVVNTMKF